MLGVLASLALVRERMPGKALIEGVLMSPLTLPGIITGVAFLQFVSLIGFSIVILAARARARGDLHALCDPQHRREPLRHRSGAGGGVARPGRGPWRTFRRILLPLMLPGITSAFIFAFITSFDNVVVSMFLISGETVTLPIRILTYVEWQFDPSVAAISTILVRVHDRDRPGWRRR